MAGPPFELDGRRGELNIVGTAGVLEDWDFVWPAGVTVNAVTVRTGGSLDENPADTAGTAEVTASTIAGTRATVPLQMPTMSQGRTPIRLYLNGTLEAFGYLRPSSQGTRQAGNVVTVRTVNSTITISAKAVGGRVDEVTGGTHVEIDSTDPTAPVADLTDAAKATLELAATAAQPAAVVATVGAAIDALNLGTAAQAATDDFATGAEGDLATSAVQPATLASTLADELGAGAAGLSSVGLRPRGSIADSFAAWLAAYEARATTPVDIVVIGDSLSTVARPQLPIAEHQPWPERLYRLLGEAGDGWRCAFPDADAPSANASTGTTTQNATGGLGSVLDVGESSTFVVGPTATVHVVWTRTPGGGDLELRLNTAGGTLLATIDTDGAQKSGMVTDVDVLASLVFGGTLVVVAAGATAQLDGILFAATDDVRVYNAARGGLSTLAFQNTPSRALDLIDNIDPDVVITATGTNDATANIEQRIEDLLVAIRARTSALIVLVVPPVTPGFFEAADAAIVRALAAADPDLLVVDLAAPFPDYTTTLTGDSLHPSELCHAAWAEVFAGVLLGDPIGRAYRGFVKALTTTRVGMARLAADLPIPGTAEVTTFTIPLEANTNYRLDGFLTSMFPTADDGRLIATVPSGATMKWGGPQLTPTATSTIAQGWFAVVGAAGNYSLGGVDAEVSSPLQGWISVGATPGNLVITARKASGDTGADGVIYAGSYVTVTPL